MNDDGNDGRMARVAQQAIDDFTAKHQARERGLRVSREVIRLSANAIRAAHRGDFDEARGLLAEARASLKDVAEDLRDRPEIYYAGFLADARKEFAEANITLALISDTPFPLPDEIGVEMAPYLNGMGEVIGELRRFILDSLRRNDTVRCEEYMQMMDDIYSLLVTVDFPEGVTSGLRRTTDAMRSILERTRGDLTMALRQRELEEKLASWEQSMRGGGQPASS